MWARIFRCSFVLGFVVCGCDVASPPATPATTAASDVTRGGKIVLGSPSLFQGIPGKGPLTLAEIKRFLAEPANHQPLEFVLPLGLHDVEPLPELTGEQTLTRAKIELGRQLFFDPRLSRNYDHFCGNCHNPKQAFANYFFDEKRREPLAVFNRIFARQQMWDGRAMSLEAQVLLPLEHPEELNLTPEELVTRLQNIPGYREQFAAVFRELSFATIAQAIAAFERAIVSGPSSWDCYRVVEALQSRQELTAEEAELLREAKEKLASNPISAAAIRGSQLFFSDRVGCAQCHSGPNFTDEAYHNLGIGMERESPDQGRFRVTGSEADRGAFRTPTLRNLLKTAPYFHDGRFFRLEETIDYLCTGGHPNPHLSPLMQPIDLTPTEKRELIEFLKALTSPLPDPVQGRLPGAP